MFGVSLLRLINVEKHPGYEMTGSPGFSRWHTCQDSGLLPGKPGPAEAGTPVMFGVSLLRLINVEKHPGYEMTGSPGFSRWHASQDSGLLPGKPGPAEAGTPEQGCPD
jgi:hypothetical protein